MSDPLETLARRAQDHPYFLAPVLAAYARSEGMDDVALAAALGCPPGRLSALRLCRVPAAEPPGFWSDITRIAGHFGLNADRLAAAVRRGQAVQRLLAGPACPHGQLLAARDDDRPDAPPPPTGGPT